MMALQLVAFADQHIIAALEHDHHVVGDHAVPAFDKIEHALRLANAALAGQQQANAVDVGE